MGLFSNKSIYPTKAEIKSVARETIRNTKQAVKDIKAAKGK